MRRKEMQEAIRLKNSRLIRQTQRINLLENKMADLRKKYFQLKYADVMLN
jgi:hypothetical protein